MKRTATSLIVSYIANAYLFIGFLATVALVSLVFRWNLDNSVGMFLSPITGFTRVFFSDLNRRPVDNYLLYWGSNVLLYFGVGWFFIKWTIAGYRRCLNDR